MKNLLLTFLIASTIAITGAGCVGMGRQRRVHLPTSDLSNLIEKQGFGDFSVKENDDNLQSVYVYRGSSKSLSCFNGVAVDFLTLYYVDVTDPSPLKGMQLLGLDIILENDAVLDLSVLKKMPMNQLLLNGGTYKNFSSIRKLPLVDLNITHAGIHDLTSLRGMNLGALAFDASHVTNGVDAIRSMTSLWLINDIPVGEFWDNYDAGKYKTHIVKPPDRNTFKAKFNMPTEYRYLMKMRQTVENNQGRYSH